MSNQLSALVVDDNFFNRDLCRLALEQRDITLEQAENGEIALQMLRQQSFSILILDLEMPIVDGHMVLAELPNIKLQAELTVFVVTANPHMTEELGDNVDFLLLKPIDIVHFSQMIDRVIAMKYASLNN